MSDFSSLLLKVNDLSTKTAKDSISPSYLAALLGDIIEQMQSIDMSEMSDEISNAISNAQTALTTAQNALDEADDATTTAKSATKTALLASERADTAVSTADAAVATTQKALATASSALEKAKTAVSTADTATETANSAVEAVATAKNELSARIDNVGILPFDGVIYHPSEISAFTVGQVCLCAELKYFIIADESAQGYSIADTYNRFDRIGTPLGPNPNYLYRLASKLYRVYDGALCALLTAEEIPFGTTEGTAYEGSAGQALDTRVSELSTELSSQVNNIGILPINGIVYHVSEAEANTGWIVWSVADKKFYYIGGDGAEDAPSAYSKSTESGVVPNDGVIYRMKGTLYHVIDTYSSPRLVEYAADNVPFGTTEGTAFEGSAGQALSDDLAVTNLRLPKIVPVSGFMPRRSSVARPKSGIWFAIASDDDDNDGFVIASFPSGFSASDYFKNADDVDTDDDEVTAEIRTDVIFFCAATLYKYSSGKFVEIGASVDVEAGNCYNVTVKLPKTDTLNPYYTLESAIQAVLTAKAEKLGMQITFAISEKAWKMYQYLGSSLAESEFADTSNWFDMAGLGAGSETLVNVNLLCGNPVGTSYYTLELALDAIARKESTSGITYRKEGMVITYKVGEGKWETKQLQQAVSSFGLSAAWTDFGGAGGNVETTDEISSSSASPVSSRGVYAALPAKMIVDEDTPGIVKLGFANGDDETLGSQIQFHVGTGSGESSGTTVTIAFPKSSLYGAVGKSILLKAAIRSVTKSGSTEVANTIETLTLKDSSTKQTVYTATVDADSSVDFEDYSFEIDMAQFFEANGKKKFILEATDALGNTGQNIITVNVDDITVTSNQTLNVNEDALITPTSDLVTVNDVFSFPKNSTDKGIEAIVEIYLNGKWQEIQRSVVTDQFGKSISFSPKELGLKHGCYQIRVQGTAVSSGVTGNTIYSFIFVVDPDNTAPMVGIRYDDDSDGVVKLYESVTFDVAAYNPVAKETIVNAKINSTTIRQQTVDNTHTFTVTKQIQGFSEGALIALSASVVPSSLDDNRVIVSGDINLKVSGSIIDAEIKDGALFSFDFSTRSNDEVDKSIVSGKYAITLSDANYTTNGFVSYLNESCLRIAENVTGTLNYSPFSGNASLLGQSGAAIQFAFATANVKDSDSKLIECYDPKSGAGFYVKGNKVGIVCRNGSKGIDDDGNPIPEERAFSCGEKVTATIVVEPTSIYYPRGSVKYSLLKMYLNGEMVASMGYTSAGDLSQDMQISFNGTNADLYLFYMLGYNSYMEFAQAFKNYLVKVPDTAAMLAEYVKEDVLVSQTAEGTTRMRPSHTELYNRGIGYYIVIAPEETFDDFDSGTDTSKKFKCDLIYVCPSMPWRSFHAYNVLWKRQGTTSAKREVKNDRFYFTKLDGWRIEALYPDYTNADAITTYALFAMGYIRVEENSFPINVVTVKVDYSDSSGVNDCGTCNLMNATFRALGDDYMTPAQRYFDGTWDKGDIHLTGLQLNHSTANHPIAVYRSTSDTLQTVYFHAKGNWKEDKNETTALGFQDIPGYNKGCLNNGKFYNFYGTEGETLDQIQTRFLASSDLKTDKPYVLRLYAGLNYRVMRYSDGAWSRSSGSMRKSGNRFVVTGDVLNPVSGYEMLQYTGLCWLKGVSKVSDMMEMSTKVSSWVAKLGLSEAPLWTYYFERMDADDDLALDLALGKMCPYELFRYLQFADSCDLDNATSEADRTARISRWENKLYLYANTKALNAYYAATDYLCLTDQQAKNMQPMWFLEDGFYVKDGVYYSETDSTATEYALRMYPNKVYDADGAWDKDNEGGCTVDAEVDPAKASDEATGYENPFAGWNSVQWVNIRAAGKTLVNASGDYITLQSVVTAMTAAQTTVDGVVINPFSKSGALHYYVDRALDWPKMVSSYDGERKYIQVTSRADQIYFYALQGLGLTSLPDYISRRWSIRDGFYQVGEFFSNSTTMIGRVAGPSNATITIKAAKRGWFAVGSEKQGNVGKAVLLEAGEQYTFSAANGDFSVTGGSDLYIYQADRLSSLDLSDLTLGKGFEDSLSVATLLETLILGSSSRSESTLSYDRCKSLKLELPFLESLDVRNTQITSIDASGCPRITSINASGSQLASLTLAETSPINDITLPATMTDVSFIGLPSLTYTGINAASGLKVVGWGKVNKLRIETSPNINPVRMLSDVLSCQSSDHTLSRLRIVAGDNMEVRGTGQELLEILSRGVAGLDSDGGNASLPVVKATYYLTRILEQSQIDDIESGIDDITVTIVVEAYIAAIDDVNADVLSGEPDVETVTLDNIGTHLSYYNGETYDEYLARIAEENSSIHDIINS